MVVVRPERVSDETIDHWLQDHRGWVRDGAVLKRTLTFADFSAAFAFMTRVAMVAEQLDHHPEWSNVYNRVEVAITTHDAGGLTELDQKFVAAVDRIVA